MKHTVRLDQGVISYNDRFGEDESESGGVEFSNSYLPLRVRFAELPQVITLLQNIYADWHRTTTRLEAEKVPVTRLERGTEEAVRFHLYPIERVLAPRGSLQKESLSALILERLQTAYQSWTDPTYGDSMDWQEVLECIKVALNHEVQQALVAFAEDFGGRDAGGQ